LKEMINVLIADDHAVVREGLKHILSETSDLKVTDEARTGHEVLEKLSRIDFDMVVLDITMPGISGLDVLKQIRSQKPRLPVLIMSMNSEDQYTGRALRAGASGCLTKKCKPEEFISAIRNVSLGRKYVSAAIAEKLVNELELKSERPPHNSLSDREYHVLLLIASGKRAKEISEELHLSAKTISTYKSRILQKMNMKSYAELINYAIKNSLVE
jgi:two-component system invasion response regulator UvrY